MFKNEYQGGNFIELLNPALKEPLVNCRVVGPHGVNKVYEKDVKGSIFQLDGMPNATKICLPKDQKQGLSLIQRCIVFQLEIPNSHDFSMEIGISDLNLNKRHLLFSTAHKEISAQPLSARIPLKNINRNEWLNLVIDVASLVNDIWKNQTLRTIDYITICANCKLRKLFSLKNVPTLESGLLAENLISQVDFPIGTESKIQIFNLNDIKPNESMDTSRIKSVDLSLSDSRSKSNRFKIAFGTKVASQNIQVSKSKSKALSNDAQLSESHRKDSITEDSLSSLSLSTKKLQPQESITNQENIVNNSEISNSKVNNKPSTAKTRVVQDKQKNPVSIENNTKILPHPPGPPQSSRRPTILSARKVQVTKKTPQEKTTQDENRVSKENEQENQINVNESISDIIQTLKMNEKVKNKNESNMYSFSSKPIVVDVESRKPQNLPQPQQNKVYDFRKYISNSPQKPQQNGNKSNEPIQIDTINTNDDDLIKNNEDFNEFMKPATEAFTHMVTLMDSFEAKMLMDMKEEMEQHNKPDLQITKRQITATEVISSAYSPLIPDSKNSNLKNQNSNSIEKYHYENLTNSFDTDTTTSISKKIYKKKDDELNNYQEEMDVSLAANIARNSVNIQNYQVNNLNKMKETPITEETRAYDDSQTTDDVTDDNSDGEIDLLYDAALNCYYDPKTCTYYELNMT